jgi:3-phenylpropionate/cinnamic acid dioxygenase small subunit
VLDGTDIVLIHQLLGKYGHTIDARDWDAFVDLFLPDAVLDYTQARAPKVCHGTEEIMESFLPANHPPAHHVTNIVVDETADPSGRVDVHSKFLVPFTRDSHVPKRMYGGDYRDVVVKTSAGWRFAEKVCIARWQLSVVVDDDVPEHRRTY